MTSKSVKAFVYSALIASIAMSAAGASAFYRRISATNCEAIIATGQPSASTQTNAVRRLVSLGATANPTYNVDVALMCPIPDETTLPASAITGLTLQGYDYSASRATRVQFCRTALVNNALSSTCSTLTDIDPPGFTGEYSRGYSNPFPGTTVQYAWVYVIVPGKHNSLASTPESYLRGLYAVAP